VAQKLDHAWETSSDGLEREQDMVHYTDGSPNHGDPRIDLESEQDPVHDTEDLPSVPAVSGTPDAIGVVQNIDLSEEIMQETMGSKILVQFNEREIVFQDLDDVIHAGKRG
jgi:hypothetical protein